ncbi:MAG: glycoside hydrolase family 5 protein [Lachnospiraceae bacterium]|nr:glycoside hydrolase family 5 protein [Lachnospiraceae bacterium]
MRQMDGYMHGVNLGGWLSQFDKYDHEHFKTFITEEDIKYIKSLGLDHIRVPIDYTVLEEEDGTVKDSGYVYLDNCAKWCKDAGLSMIIDLHKTFGYSFDPLDDTDKTIFFKDESLQKRFYDLWARIADRYKDYSDHVAYELLNEIIFPEISDNWNQIALKALSVIRQYAKNSWVIFGGVRYNAVTSVPMLAMTDDERVAYTFHCYEPFVFTHQGAYWVKNMPSDFRIKYPAKMDEFRENAKALPDELAGSLSKEPYCNIDQFDSRFFEILFTPALETSKERDIPLYCGEYGAIDLADDRSKVNWARDICAVFDKYGIGRAYWNYKEKDYGIINIEDKEIQKELGTIL